MSATLYESDVEEDPDGLLQRMRDGARKAWTVFAVVNTLTGAVVTFDRIADAGLLPPAGETQQQALPSGPPVDEGATPSSPDSGADSGTTLH